MVDVKKLKKRLKKGQKELENNPDIARAKELVAELEMQQKEWQDLIDDMKDKQAELRILLGQVRTLRKGI